MKKLISVLMSLCIVINTLPFFIYAAPLTEEISFDEFVSRLMALKEQYDAEYIGEIIVEDGSEICYVDGESVPLELSEGELVRAEVSQSGIDIPLSVLEENCAEISEYEDTTAISKAFTKTKQYSKPQSVEAYAEQLGYEVEITDSAAVFTQPFQTHRLIVKSKYDIDPLDSVAIVEGYNDLHIVQFDSRESTVEAFEYYNNQKRIEYAEPEIIVSTQEYESNDTVLSASDGGHLSWGSEYIGVDDYIDFLGDVDSLPEITVAVIDTGVELTHELLSDRIIRTGFNVSGTGSADSENDDKGHGTHVAGIIADNTTENVKIKGYKVLNSQGKGTNLSVCLGIDKAVEDGVNVINMSLGGSGDNETMHESIQRAVAQGITVCVSAGNSNANAEQYSPAGFAECITVAALKEDGTKAAFSNWGKIVDVIAPGVAINSSFLENSYKSLSGTSMSSPFVSAASAMILSKNSSLDCDGVLACIVEHQRTDWEQPFYMRNAVSLYIGDASKLPAERTAPVKFSVASCDFSESFELELSCDDDADIYFTTDGSRATLTNGELYTQPISVTKTTTVHAIAVSEGKTYSVQSVATYTFISVEPESTFVINSNGIITKYNGKDINLIIPETVDGITVTGIGEKVFYNYPVREIIFPDTVTYIGKSAFENCMILRSVEGGNIQNIADRAFCYCYDLDEFDFSTVTSVGESSFYKCKSITQIINDKIPEVYSKTFCSMENLKIVSLTNVRRVNYYGLRDNDSLEAVDLPKVEYLGGYALSDCPLVERLEFPSLKELDSRGYQFMRDVNLKTLIAPELAGALPKGFMGRTEITSLVLPKAEIISKDAFDDSSKIEMLYLPGLLEIESGAFYCSYHSVEGFYYEDMTFFVPNAKYIYALPKSEKITVYTNYSLYYLPDNPKSDITVIAPYNSYTYEWAVFNEKTAVNSLALIESTGESKRSYDSSLRFGFLWEEIEELNEYAESISYGFEYSRNGLNYQGEAVNKVYSSDEGKTAFNLVLSNIPNEEKNTQISARAVIDIDGMIFKSPMITADFNSVQNVQDDLSLGDVNRDSFVDIADYQLILAHISGDNDLIKGTYGENNSDSMYDYTSGMYIDKTQEFLVADVNADCAVDAFDLYLIDRMVNKAA